MARKLKVFRTSTGFHDAYVAAPSRAAALRAWGSDKDLFARGDAEEIHDPKLAAEALAQPGVVIRKSRGSLAEQLAALPDDRPRAERAARQASSDGPQRRRTQRGSSGAIAPAANPAAPKTRPSRTKLDRAETGAANLEIEQRKARDALVEREEDLRRERRQLEALQAKEREKAASAIEKAKVAYDLAVERWRLEN